MHDEVQREGPVGLVGQCSGSGRSCPGHLAFSDCLCVLPNYVDIFLTVSLTVPRWKPHTGFPASLAAMACHVTLGAVM